MVLRIFIYFLVSLEVDIVFSSFPPPRGLFSAACVRARGVLLSRAGVSRVIQPNNDAATATVALAGAESSEGGLAGTQAYMAPEMLQVLRRLAAVSSADAAVPVIYPLLFCSSSSDSFVVVFIV